MSIGDPMNNEADVKLADQAWQRRQLLHLLGRWSPVVILGVIGAGRGTLAQAVNWNDCPTREHWLNSSGSGGHWINSNDRNTHLQGGHSGEDRPPPRNRQPANPWLNGNRDGWTNRQDCHGGTWVNY